MKRVVIGVAGFALIVALAVWAKGCLDVDRCLDAGGRWNYELEDCQLE